MNTFVINLQENSVRRMAIKSQLDETNLNYEFIEAIKGSNLSDGEIKTLVYDYPHCKLTKGEIGCALSHLSIYKRIVQENISHALIFEDDAVIPKNIAKIFQEIRQLDNDKKANVYLLSRVHNFIENSKLNNNLYSAYQAIGAHAYIINNKAAKRMILAQKPIIYEADMWWYFKFFNYINVYCYIPHIVNSSDENKDDSSLELERAELVNDRAKYRSLVRKKIKYYQYYRVKDLILRKYFLKIKTYK